MGREPFGRLRVRKPACGLKCFSGFSRNGTRGYRAFGVHDLLAVEPERDLCDKAVVPFRDDGFFICVTDSTDCAVFNRWIRKGGNRQRYLDCRFTKLSARLEV